MMKKIYRSVFYLVILAVVGLTAHQQILGADGDIDPTFGTGGRVRVNNVDDVSDRARTVAVQPDGKIVVGGDTNGSNNTGVAALNRLNPDGSLDLGFGNGGKIIGPQTSLGGVVILPDGKILTVGSIRASQIPVVNFVLTRYNPDGTLDTTFGVDGYAMIGPQTQSIVYTFGNALVIQPDGKIVAVGVATINPGGDRFLLARFNADGSRDESFGSAGVVFTRFTNGETQALAVGLQADGKIVAGGYNVADQVTRNFALARYNTNGALDLDFGLEGQVTTNFAFRNFAQANGVVIQPDGKIIAAGGFTRQATGFLLARYKSDGRLDQEYGTGGKVTTGFVNGGTGYGHAALLQPDGKLLVGGTLAFSGMNSTLLLARYNTDGSYDQSFGNGGVVISEQEAGFDEGFALAFQPDRKLIAAGAVDEPGGSYQDFALARYIVSPAAPRRTKFDFDGDSRADISVFREGMWYLLQGTEGFAAAQFGLATDRIVPADYDGDGKTDIAVFRPSEGNWYCLYSGNGTWSGVHFGTDGDVPAPGDYDADGRADYAVFRAGTWYVQRSSAGFFAEQFGLSTDRPVAADFDGDGKTDIAVYRDGTWYIDQSSQGFTARNFGLAGDRTTAADYDGDGKADIAVWRPSEGNWYVFRSSDGGVGAAHWGMQGDIPAAADYDGDGRADYAVFRGNGDWWISQSGSGAVVYEKFGLTGDMPIPNSVVR
jgi:uncharacterized delta-60 repeat protein